VNDAPIDTKPCGECQFPLCDCGCGNCTNVDCSAQKLCPSVAVAAVEGGGKAYWFWECDCADEDGGTGVADSKAEAIADAVQYLIDQDVEDATFAVGPAQRIRAAAYIVEAAGLLFDFGELTYNLCEAAEFDPERDAFRVPDEHAARADLEAALRAWADKHVESAAFEFHDSADVDGMAEKTSHTFEARDDDEEGLRFFLDGEELSDPEADT
jgi:hypothetical protein